MYLRVFLFARVLLLHAVQQNTKNVILDENFGHITFEIFLRCFANSRMMMEKFL